MPPTDSLFRDREVAFSLELLAKRYNYNHWIYNSIRGYVGENILEVGAGIGNITDFLMSRQQLTLIDIDRHFVEFLRQRYAFRTAESLRVLQADVAALAGSGLGAQRFDTVIALNILEHVRDDAKAVANMVNLLQPGGRLVILVPAMPVLYGSMDKAYGHFRRYSPRMLRALFCRQPVRVRKLWSMNLPGVFAWFLDGRLLGRTELTDRQTHCFDAMVPFIAMVERLARPPLGLSLVAVVERQADEP